MKLTGNELIAEFMDWKKWNKDIYYIPDGFELIKEEETTFESNWGWFLIEQDTCKVQDMKFHTSWDWLMPVVEKIESLKIKDYNTNVYITSSKVYISVTHFGTGAIWNMLLSNYNELYTNKTKIEKVYIAVVEFIKWYNKNK